MFFLGLETSRMNPRIRLWKTSGIDWKIYVLMLKVHCSLDYLRPIRYDGWGGMLFNLNDSFTFAYLDYVIFNFKRNENLSYMVYVHDPNFFYYTYNSLDIPRLFYKLSSGEHYLGVYRISIIPLLVF